MKKKNIYIYIYIYKVNTSYCHIYDEVIITYAMRMDIPQTYVILISKTEKIISKIKIITTKGGKANNKRRNC